MRKTEEEEADDEDKRIIIPCAWGSRSVRSCICVSLRRQKCPDESFGYSELDKPPQRWERSRRCVFAVRSLHLILRHLVYVQIKNTTSADISTRKSHVLTNHHRITKLKKPSLHSIRTSSLGSQYNGQVGSLSPYDNGTLSAPDDQ
ncbi:hypothetical protein VNO78_05607 [Psophocarpus tetragonolobus]|uniref:Uncharacterized protein n=1 Tax=Psophocarpus tetragonolobus TaxID=3891 RepID=A0AAN9T100_PSOTE